MIIRRTKGHRQSCCEQEERQRKLNDRDRKEHQNAFKITTNQIYLDKQTNIQKLNYKRFKKKKTKYKEISNTKEKRITPHIRQRGQARRNAKHRERKQDQRKKKDVSAAMEWERLLVKSLKANRTGLRKQYETTTKYGKEDSLRYK